MNKAVSIKNLGISAVALCFCLFFAVAQPCYAAKSPTNVIQNKFPVGSFIYEEILIQAKPTTALVAYNAAAASHITFNRQRSVVIKRWVKKSTADDLWFQPLRREEAFEKNKLIAYTIVDGRHGLCSSANLDITVKQALPNLKNAVYFNEFNPKYDDASIYDELLKTSQGNPPQWGFMISPCTVKLLGTETINGRKAKTFEYKFKNPYYHVIHFSFDAKTKAKLQVKLGLMKGKTPDFYQIETLLTRKRISSRAIKPNWLKPVQKGLLVDSVSDTGFTTDNTSRTPEETIDILAKLPLTVYGFTSTKHNAYLYDAKKIYKGISKGPVPGGRLDYVSDNGDYRLWISSYRDWRNDFHMHYDAADIRSILQDELVQAGPIKLANGQQAQAYYLSSPHYRLDPPLLIKANGANVFIRQLPRNYETTPVFTCQQMLQIASTLRPITDPGMAAALKKQFIDTKKLTNKSEQIRRFEYLKDQAKSYLFSTYGLDTSTNYMSRGSSDVGLEADPEYAFITDYAYIDSPDKDALSLLMFGNHSDFDWLTGMQRFIGTYIKSYDPHDSENSNTIDRSLLDGLGSSEQIDIILAGQLVKAKYFMLADYQIGILRADIPNAESITLAGSNITKEQAQDIIGLLVPLK